MPTCQHLGDPDRSIPLFGPPLTRTFLFIASCMFLSWSRVFPRPPFMRACSPRSVSSSLRIATLRSWSGPPRFDDAEILFLRSFCTMSWVSTCYRSRVALVETASLTNFAWTASICDRKSSCSASSVTGMSALSSRQIEGVQLALTCVVFGLVRSTVRRRCLVLRLAHPPSAASRGVDQEPEHANTHTLDLTSTTTAFGSWPLCASGAAVDCCAAALRCALVSGPLGAAPGTVRVAAICYDRCVFLSREPRYRRTWNEPPRVGTSSSERTKVSPFL